MIRPQDCEILQWRSFDDEAAFFASMGRFFASAGCAANAAATR